MPLPSRPKAQVPLRPFSGSDGFRLPPSPPNHYFFPRPSGRNGRKSGRPAVAANVSLSLLAVWERGFPQTLSSPSQTLPRLPAAEHLHEGGVFSPPSSRQSLLSRNKRGNLQHRNTNRLSPSHLYPPCRTFRDLLSRKQWRFLGQINTPLTVQMPSYQVSSLRGVGTHRVNSPFL